MQRKHNVAPGTLSVNSESLVLNSYRNGAT